MKFKPWINKKIIKLIKEKKQTYKKYTKDKDLFWYNRYKTLGKQVKAMIDKSKKSYLRNFFQENTKNAKESWSKINEVLSNRKKGFDNIYVGDNGRIITILRNCVLFVLAWVAWVACLRG